MTGEELKQFVLSKLGTNYVYGMKGKIMTLSKYNWLRKAYPKYVKDKELEKVGTVCTDCSGLIGWGTGLHRNSYGYKEHAKELHPIKTICTAPVGVAVWKKGHIGVYIGMSKSGVPYCVEAKGSKYGVVKSNVKKTSFTHWFELDCVNYPKELPNVSRETLKGIDVKQAILKE